MDDLELDKNVRDEIRAKLREYFNGKIVREDLTKKIKEGANVPVYVLEYLLGQYCNSEDEEIIQDGVETVKKILASNYVRPDEAQKVLSLLREQGTHTIIDMVSVALNIKKDRYEASFSNLGLTGIPIGEEFPTKYDRLLRGGIWCIVRLEYASEYEPEPELPEFMHKASPQIQTGRQKHKKREFSPITVCSLKPIQMPHIDMEQLREGRKAFTKEEWIDVLLRSSGMEPDEFTYREKWLLLNRMLPLVENNFNFCELGPRSTRKSHLYKEISPNSILVSGGQTTVANLFYNMGRHAVGLVGLWDCVAFDEVAGIKFKDNDGVQIMKDYMASGSFARGKEEISASASMVLWEILIRVWMSFLKHRASLILSLRRWERIRHSLTAFAVIIRGGKFQNSVRNILRMIMDLSLTTWLNLCASCVRKVMVMLLTSSSDLERI